MASTTTTTPTATPATVMCRCSARFHPDLRRGTRDTGDGDRDRESVLTLVRTAA